MNSITAQELLQYDFINGLISFIIGLIGLPISCYYLYKIGKKTWDDYLQIPSPICMFILIPVLLSASLLFAGADKVLKVLIAPNSYLQERMKD